ncbi:chemotaxis response regulator protein-glutamate methylesterase [Hansschlegelia quercus]|uniref:Protein-glutamate methylesterase/protein-glutamine glutaminase n=1 Tax=Hansschlegelia quercus TaxID=2528245 RepID=A0A4Q9GJG1_9HYPH|nr:chemotaxis response regulator protein-glutamate methylesterase [Hansschlegelia quercus]TBN52598.1 chemotaxis response regulator protein-glutamate methylesterase [Hansschlegelia quercus]
MAAVALPVSAAEIIRVMIVDDSVVIRSILTRWLSEAPGFEIVAAHRTGRAAVEDVTRAKPHVVVLDIEMPDMDGLTALPLLLKATPGVAVLMASALTRRNAEVSLRCLAMGAADYVAKPEASQSGQDEYRRGLVAKVRGLGEAVLRREDRRPAYRPAAPRIAAVAPVRVPQAAAPAAMRKPSLVRPKALAIGSSTGGPKALETVLMSLGPQLASVPVIITQHMPATFTAVLAEHLGRATGRPAHEAIDGETLQPGVIYVAPGGRHLKIARRGGSVVAALSDDPPENFCRPSVDPMFRSAAEVYGPALLAVVLTGMGSDGAASSRAVVGAGGTVIAQDEATSVVWGMPGATVAAGSCSAVLPLQSIGPKIARLLSGDAK